MACSPALCNLHTLVHVQPQGSRNSRSLLSRPATCRHSHLPRRCSAPTLHPAGMSQHCRSAKRQTCPSAWILSSAAQPLLVCYRHLKRCCSAPTAALLPARTRSTSAQPLPCVLQASHSAAAQLLLVYAADLSWRCPSQLSAACPVPVSTVLLLSPSSMCCRPVTALPPPPAAPPAPLPVQLGPTQPQTQPGQPMLQVVAAPAVAGLLVAVAPAVGGLHAGRP